MSRFANKVRLGAVVLCLVMLFIMSACAKMGGIAADDAILEKQEETNNDTQNIENGTDENISGETVEQVLKVAVGDIVFTAELADNSTVDALKVYLSQGPVTLEMSDYAGMEKGVDLDTELPRNDVQMNAEAGDIILYNGHTLVIYYDENSWSLTPVAKIIDADPGQLREVLGTGDVSVTFYLEENRGGEE